MLNSCLTRIRYASCMNDIQYVSYTDTRPNLMHPCFIRFSYGQNVCFITMSRKYNEIMCRKLLIARILSKAMTFDIEKQKIGDVLYVNGRL